VTGCSILEMSEPNDSAGRRRRIVPAGIVISRSTGVAAAVSVHTASGGGAGFVFAIVPANSSPQAIVSEYARNRCMHQPPLEAEATIVPLVSIPHVGAERRGNAGT